MDYINELLQSLNIDSKVIVACSGGPDSMFLLHVLKEYGLDVICAHVNHNLREESKEEYEYVKSYCEENNITFEGTELHDLPQINTELKAREKRYEFFKTLIDKYNAKYLFTAHHGDDLIETILMRLTRGSTMKGYSGISLITKKDKYEIIRPLLFLTKDDIMKYIDENHIPYVVDNSNSSLKYTRNRYRANILPILKKENNIVHQKFLKYSRMIEEYDTFIINYVNNIYDKIVIDNKIKINLFLSEDKLIQRNILEKYIYSIYGDDIVCWDDIKTNILFNMISDPKPNIIVDFPNNIKGIKEYNLLYMIKSDNQEEYEFEIKDKVVVPDGVIEVLKDSQEKDNFITYLNSEDINLPLYVRSIKIGDKMTIKNMKDAKKIKDIFINEKVPVSKRKTWPIVVDSKGNVLWLPGLKKSQFDSQKSGKYDIILKYYV